jgi:Xaa-Pro aminopeptidase
MFEPAVYRERRNRLKKDVGSGLILLLGNDDVGMNYAANTYHFRQDSSFLYYFAVNLPGLAAVIDIDADAEILYGDDLTLADVVWTGPQPTIGELARQSDTSVVAPLAALDGVVGAAIAQGRRVHFLKPYRPEHTLKITHLLGIKPSLVPAYRSEPLHKAIAAQRNIKSPAEVAEIESAIDVSHEMYLAAMAAARPGLHEYDVVAEIIRVAKARHCDLSFPIICSVHGETLHNHLHANPLAAGDVMVLDSGVETAAGYASDITRTIPIGGRFSTQQRAIYEMVLRAQATALGAIRPGVPYRDVHLLASKSFATDLKAAGLLKGDVGEAVAAGAHALFFPHGLGHMLGLDVHDMENIGEHYVGYEPGIDRSPQFGLGYLRLARRLQPGFVLTVEPGLYFIPALIDQWTAERHLEAFINYAEVEKYRDARGFRVEDDVLVTESGSRVLGAAIPKTVADVEQASVK